MDRKRDFFDKRLTKEQENFYKKCMLRKPDALQDLDMDRKEREMEKKIKRSKFQMNQRKSQKPLKPKEGELDVKKILTT